MLSSFSLEGKLYEGRFLLTKWISKNRQKLDHHHWRPALNPGISKWRPNWAENWGTQPAQGSGGECLLCVVWTHFLSIWTRRREYCGHLEKDFEEEVGNKRKCHSYTHSKCVVCLSLDSVSCFSLLPSLFPCAFPSVVSTLYSKCYNEPSGPDCSHL